MPKNIAIITDIAFWQPGLGNHARISSLLLTLLDHARCTLVYLSDNEPEFDHLSNNYPGLEVDHLSGLDFQSSSDCLALEQYYASKSFDIAIVEYLHLHQHVDYLPASCLKLLDSHDLLSSRAQAFIDYGRTPVIDIDTDTEFLIFNKFDKVIFIQQREYDLGCKYLGNNQCLLVPHLQKTIEINHSHARAVVFIGSAAKPNVDGILWFWRNVWPLFDQELPFAVFGNVCSDAEVQAEIPKKYLRGPVDNLAEVYSIAYVTLCPLQYGGGLKIKVVESLAHGVPVMSTSVGVDGFPDVYRSGVQVADKPLDFAQSLLALLKDSPSIQQASNLAVAYTRDYFDPDMLVKSILEISTADVPNKALAHVVNPVNVPITSDLHVAQPVTFKAMKAAKASGSNTEQVELLQISYAEDAISLEGFKALPFLNRSVMDVGQFSKVRKLPLIADILNTAAAQTSAEYLIYSNVDISPMPHFYQSIEDLLQHHDALVINRRSIDKSYSSDRPLTDFYIQNGESHPGFDCFVFKKSLLKQFTLGETCIGANWVGRVLLCNLFAYAQSPKILTDQHITFHLGDDRSWKTSDNAQFDHHNAKQLMHLFTVLDQQGVINSSEVVAASVQSLWPRFQHLLNPIETIYPGLPDHYMSESDYRAGEGPLPQNPVFIVGSPRSGTTLAQSLIATQLSPVVFPETHFFSLILPSLKVIDDRIDPISIPIAMSLIDQKYTVTETLKAYIEKLGSLGQLSPKMLFEAIVFDLIQQRHPGSVNYRWLEKTPGHVNHLDSILGFYPDVQVICMVRDPLSVIDSRRKNLSEFGDADLPVSELAKQWNQSVETSQIFARKNPGQLEVIPLELMTGQTKGLIQELCHFLNCEFNEQKLTEYADYSSQQTLSWETWKQEAGQGIRQEAKPLALSLDQQHEISFITYAKAKNFGYQAAIDSSEPIDSKPSNDSIGVLIIVDNDLESLKLTFSSVCLQSHENLQIHVVDMSCDADVGEYLESVGNLLTSSAKFSGGSFNKAWLQMAEAADSDWLITLPSGVKLTDENCLQRALSQVLEDDQIVYGHTRLGQPEDIELLYTPPQEYWWQGDFVFSSFIARKSVFSSYKLEANYPDAADIDWLLKCAKNSVTSRYLGGVIAEIPKVSSRPGRSAQYFERQLDNWRLALAYQSDKALCNHHFSDVIEQLL